MDGGIDVADLEARLILSRRADLGWADIIARPDMDISNKQLNNIESDVSERLKGMPLSRLYGEKQFWGLDFALSPETLDPRPDTEILVEQALKAFKAAPPITILDLGTGTGCILISLLSEWKQSRGVGVDVSSGALKTAQNNAKTHGVDARASFIQSDWFDSIEGKFDLIVSNPPYIAAEIIPNLSKEVKNHDPILALEGGHDGLQAYKKIFSSLKSHLNPHGKALLEIGFDQREDVARLAEESDFFVKDVHLDLAGKPRVVEISCGDK